jgi:hypothetical protein
LLTIAELNAILCVRLWNAIFVFAVQGRHVNRLTAFR